MEGIAGAQASISVELVSSVMEDYSNIQVIRATLEKLNTSMIGPAQTVNPGCRLYGELPDAEGVGSGLNAIS